MFPLSASDGTKTYFSFLGIPALGTGKFLPQKATKLGCKPKEHFKTLVDGNSVTLPDGTVVHPSMVTEEPEPVAAFCTVFLPSASFVPSFLQRNLSLFTSVIREQISVVYHSMPLDVVMSTVYRKEFICLLPKALHVLDCEETNVPMCARTRVMPHYEQIRQICPLLIPIAPSEEKTPNELKLDSDVNYVVSELGL